MGVMKFQIEINNNPILSYFPGQTIFGKLHVITNKDCKNEGIRLKFEGKAEVHWTEQKTVREPHHHHNGRRNRGHTHGHTRVITEHFCADEQYFVYTLHLLGTGFSRQVLPPGHHMYPFQFTLPAQLPSSFVGKSGMVWYEIEAVMKRSWKSDYVAKVPFTVNGILDLNTEFGASQPLDVRKFKHLCCLMCKSGPIGFVMSVPRKGFVSGEFLKFIAELSNQSNRRVKGVKVQLVQTVTYHSTKKSISASKIICEARGPAVEPGDTEIWTGNILKIPPLPPTRLANCRIIDVQYTLKMEMDLAGLSINLRHDIPIIIGSIPLRDNFQDILILQSAGATVGPSAPPRTLLFNDQTSFLQDAYPDLPPPTYAETIMQDQFTRFGGASGEGDVNLEFKDEGGPSTAAQPSAPPVYTETNEGPFAPKYLTYGWQ